MQWKFLFNYLICHIFLTSSCGFLFPTVNNFFKVSNPQKSIQYDNQNSVSPVLDFLDQQHKTKQQNQINFDTPSYTQNDREIFNWLATRVISVVSLVRSYNLLSNDYKYYLDYGTATILGPANQATKNNQAYDYYLASNSHVFSFFDNNYLKANNRELVSSYYSFNPYFAQLISANQFPNQQQLRTDIDHLLLKTDIDHRNYYWPFFFNYNHYSIKGDYYPFKIDQNFFWFAKNIKVNNAINSILTLPQEQSQHGNYKFAGDFAVLRANLKPVNNYYSWNYFKNLTDNIQKYGDIQFDITNATSGYLLGYPVSNKNINPKTNAPTVTVNLKMNLSSPPQKRQLTHYPNHSNSNNDLLKIGNESFLTPVDDYVIPYLNLGGGSSGSPLITYHNSSDDTKKFKMNGIYWGIFYTPSDSYQEPTISNSYGQITKLISPNRYDLIGNQPIANTPHQNSLCDFLRNKDKTFTPGFCVNPVKNVAK